MAKKKREEEPENLERWLVSYGDFITLLFATFVVLYALAQVDVSDFAKLEQSLKHAFSQNALFEGQESIMNGSESIFDQQQMADSFIPSLMMEYISPKYEETSFKEIEKTIQELTKSGELDGISAQITEKGLLLTFEDKYLFAPASAHLDNNAKKLLDKVGVLICKKFIMHSMRVEGHTDSAPMRSSIYPSNWELSAARASSVVRYMINRFKFSPSLFSAVGYADTRPLKTSISSKDPINRRVEILILKNKYARDLETVNDRSFNLSKEEQEVIQERRKRIIAQVEGDAISPAAQKLLFENREKIQRQKSETMSKRNKELYINIDDNSFADKTMPAVNKRVIKLNSNIIEDEDFGL